MQTLLCVVAGQGVSSLTNLADFFSPFSLQICLCPQNLNHFGSLFHKPPHHTSAHTNSVYLASDARSPEWIAPGLCVGPLLPLRSPWCCAGPCLLITKAGPGLVCLAAWPGVGSFSGVCWGDEDLTPAHSWLGSAHSSHMV